MAVKNTNLWTEFNGVGFSAKHSEYAERASNDVTGNDLTLTIADSKVTAIGGKPIAGVSQIPDPTEDNVILGGSADGTKSWLPISTEQFGDVITDATGDPILDDNDEPITGENFATLVAKVNNVGIGAERARADADGNDIIVTYATKADIALKQPLFYDAGSLTDGSTVNVHNNAIQQLSSSQSALTLNVNLSTGEVPNFAIEISASTDITLTVTKTVNNTATTLYPSEAGGNSLGNGKFYQVTCVGRCWTLAEFTVPST